jgi:hypothetical protein
MQRHPKAQHNSMPPLSNRRSHQHKDVASDDGVHKQHTTPHKNPNDVFKQHEHRDANLHAQQNDMQKKDKEEG